MSMLRKAALGALALGGAALLPALAEAAPGYTTGNVNLRAGPSTSYPSAGVVPAGTGVEIYGCLGGWDWCDVGVGASRGWIAGAYLQASYQGQRVPFASYAPRIGVPIISFSIGNYWDRYYRDRPFYRDRGRWDRRYHAPAPSYRAPDYRRDYPRYDPRRSDRFGPEDFRRRPADPPGGKEDADRRGFGSDSP